jgi:hypothetical protein
MIFWNFDTPVTFVACCVWNFLEYFNLSAGKYAPKLFELAIGKSGKKIK